MHILDAITPNYSSFETGSCRNRENYYLEWLADSHYNKIPIATFTSFANSNSKRVQVDVIQKQYSITKPSYLIVQCQSDPYLEGFGLHYLHDQKLTRPFCIYANYNYNPHTKGELKSKLEKVNLLLPERDSLHDLLITLLLMNNLTIGSKFSENLYNYSEIMRKEGLVKKQWFT